MAVEKLLRHQIRLLKSKKPKTLMMAGRGAGKSQGAGRLVLKLLSEHKSILISGPTYKQLKIVLFREIETALRLHGVPYHLDKSQMIFTVTIGGEDLFVYGVSADSYESARGYTNITALIMDEAALHTKQCLDVLMACLRGQFEPQVYLLTTPRGSSNWTAAFLDDPDCEVITCGTKDNFFLSPAYIELLEKQYSGDFYRQEILGEIVDSITQALLSTADVKRMRQNLPVPAAGVWGRVAGLDVGLSLGGDPSVLVVREGPNFIDSASWQLADTNELATRVVQELVRLRVHTLVIDSTAIGKGPADVIRKMFPNTILINFGASSTDPAYTNRRAQIWMTMARKIKEGVISMPADGDVWNDVCEELGMTEYMLMRSTNKMMLEPKDKVKSKLGRSPDAGDAAALTFAIPDILLNEPTMPISGESSWHSSYGSNSWMG